jgi:hypothetical protein
MVCMLDVASDWTRTNANTHGSIARKTYSGPGWFFLRRLLRQKVCAPCSDARPAVKILFRPARHNWWPGGRWAAPARHSNWAFASAYFATGSVTGVSCPIGLSLMAMSS